MKVSYWTLRFIWQLSRIFFLIQSNLKLRRLKKSVLGDLVSVLGFERTTGAHLCSHPYCAGDLSWTAAQKSISIDVHCSETARALSLGVDAVCRPRRRLLRSHLLPAVTPEAAGELLLFVFMLLELKNVISKRDWLYILQRKVLINIYISV